VGVVQVGVVQATHRIMREHKLGDRLPSDELLYFLALCNHNITSIAVGEEEMVQEMKRALEAVEFHDGCKTR
jgi:hypothetical protein